MNFIRIAFRDISSIFKNRLIRVSVTAIVIVPLLYSMLYLDAFWDPYSKLSKMPVAVVNEDQGGTRDGKAVNYGKDLTDKLLKDHELGFKLVDEKTAKAGLDSKKGYYSMFVIPDHFTANILKAKDGIPQQAEIYYTSNDKKNFLASQITGKAVLQMQSELTKQLVNEDVKVVFNNLYDIKSSLKKAADGSKKLYDNMKTAQDGSKKLADGLLTMKGKIPELSSGVTALYNGSGTLAQGIQKAQTGTQKLNGGAKAMKNGLNQLKSQTPALADGVKKLYDGSKTLSTGLKSANDGLKNKILPGSKALADGLAKLNDGFAAVDTGNKQLTAASAELNKAVGSAAATGTLMNGAASLTTGANKLKAGTASMKPGVQKLVEGANSLKTGSLAVAAGVDSLITQTSKSQSILKDATNTQLGAYLKANPSAMADANMKKFLGSLSALSTSAEDPKTTAQVAALKNGAHAVANGAGELATGLGTLQAGVGLFADSAVAFGTGAAQYAAGTQKFANGANQFTAGTTVLGNGLSSASAGVKALSAGATALDTALKGDFSNGIGALYTGAAQLNGGLGALNGNIPALSDGINKLSSGAAALTNGTDSLETGMTALTNGSKTLHNGLGKLKGNIPALASGTNELYNGSTKLSAGVGKLSDGSKELASKLADGYRDIDNNLKISSERMADYVSAPVHIEENAIHKVKNYGTGFTPYFIPLSLWVGALMMFFIISEKVDDDIKASSMSLVIGKFISYCFIGTIQAVLASSVVLALGLKPSNLPLYYLFNILMSYAFIAIIQCLVFLMGMVGRLLAIVLLILQLTSCAGTFPLELVPKFFKVLNPYMPFTYAVSGMRETISGITGSTLVQDSTVLVIILFAFLFISVFLKKHADKVKTAIEQERMA